MTRPGIEPRSPGPLANTLTAGPMSRCIYIYIYIPTCLVIAQDLFWVTACFIFVYKLDASWNPWAGDCYYYCYSMHLNGDFYSTNHSSYLPRLKLFWSSNIYITNQHVPKDGLTLVIYKNLFRIEWKSVNKVLFGANPDNFFFFFCIERN